MRKQIESVSKAFGKSSISHIVKVKNSGGIDILINAAGISRPQRLFAIEPDVWESTMESNLTEIYYTMQSVIILMISGKDGSIVNISSTAGLREVEGQCSYSASKAGVIGLSKTTAFELAPKNIRVNVVAPGYTETDMTAQFDDVHRKRFIEQIPMHRFGTAKETAQLCVFLASDKAAYITSMTAILTALIMICQMTGCGKSDADIQPNIVIDMNNDYENTVEGSGKMTSKSFYIPDNLNYRLIVSSISISNSSVKVNIVSSGTNAVIEADNNVIDDFRFDVDKESNTISLSSNKATMYNKLNCTININQLVSVYEDGTLCFQSENIVISMFRRIQIVGVYLAILMFAVILIYSMNRTVNLLKKNKPEKSTVIQLIMLVTALTVTLCVSYVIFDNCNNRYVKETGKNLINTSYRVGETITVSDMENIDSPNFSLSDKYDQLNEKINTVISDKNNAENNLYCVIYKLKNDVVYEAYRDDGIHGSMYPMAGSFSGSIEERISEENDFDIAYEFELSEGSFIYSIVPVYDNSGNTIAFVETGMDYGKFSAETKALYVKVLIAAAMAVIIIMLLFSEIFCSVKAVRDKKISRKNS